MKESTKRTCLYYLKEERCLVTNYRGIKTQILYIVLNETTLLRGMHIISRVIQNETKQNFPSATKR